jgi:hypothetical protein
VAQAQSAVSGQEYIGPNRIVSLNVPNAPNWAGVPYKVTPLNTKGDPQYDKVMLHADDFGQYLVVGVRMMPSVELARLLGRNYKNVHTDVTKLVELGLIERAQDQRITVAWDTITAEMKLAA